MTSREPERDLLESLDLTACAGLIIAPSSEANLRLLRELLARIPMVQVDRKLANLPAPWVGIDNAEAGRNAVEHLAAHGHRHIAVVGGNAAVSTNAGRLAGAMSCAEAVSGLRVFIGGLLVVSRENRNPPSCCVRPIVRLRSSRSTASPAWQR